MNTVNEEPLTGVALPPHTAPGALELSPLARAAVDAGMPYNTRRKYRRDWAEFTRWCADRGREPLPASAETLTEFATYLCYERLITENKGYAKRGTIGMRPRSAEQVLWAVAKAHELAGYPAPQRASTVQVLKGYRAKLAAEHDPRAVPRKATATTREEMPVLAGRGAARNVNPLIAVRDQALLYVNYVCAARVSELVQMNAEDIREDPRGLVISVYRKKTGAREDAAIPEAEAPQAVAAIREWLAVLAGHGKIPGPLFPRISKGGVIGAPAHGGAHRDYRDSSEAGAPDGRMGARSAGNRIATAAGLAGMEHRTAHSQRAGFATSARDAGHDALTIGRHGGAWADNSPALAGYIRDADKWARNPLRGAGV